MKDVNPEARINADAAEFRRSIQRDYRSLPKKLQQVAKFVLDNPNIVAFETVSRIADESGTHPSTIVRFAQEFGFEGASHMQKLFRDELLLNRPSLSYQNRLKALSATDDKGKLSASQLLSEFVDGSVLTLQHLLETANQKDLDKAVRIIAKSASLYITGFRRSFPVALYQYYALRRVNKVCHLLDGLGGIALDVSKQMKKSDALIATSFYPYAPETAKIVKDAGRNGSSIISLTDSEVSPIAASADVCFLLPDAQVRQFNSLAAPMCLSQALIVAYGLKAQAR